ncbi:MAG: Uma2 family endonuclease [Phycisphaerae bacterium]
MADVVNATNTREARYHGLRMTAEAFFQLGEDPVRYELIDGVVCMSPSPSPIHQALIAEIITQFGIFLRSNPMGRASCEVDIHLGRGPQGADLVYRPDIVFLRSDRLAEIGDHITGAPDLVGEIVSPASRSYPTETKKNDYERCGVREYWLIDPERESMTFYHLQDGRYEETRPEAGRLASKVVPGFALDLSRVRKAFKPW